MYALVCGCVLMDRQMGRSRGTVDEGFTLQLALSAPLCCNTHTQGWQKRSAGTECVCQCAWGVCVLGGGFGVAAALASGGQLPFYMKEAQLL